MFLSTAKESAGQFQNEGATTLTRRRRPAASAISQWTMAPRQPSTMLKAGWNAGSGPSARLRNECKEHRQLRDIADALPKKADLDWPA